MLLLVFLSSGSRHMQAHTHPPMHRLSMPLFNRAERVEPPLLLLSLVAKLRRRRQQVRGEGMERGGAGL